MNFAPSDIPEVAITVEPDAAPLTDVPIRTVKSLPLAPLAVTEALTSDALSEFPKSNSLMAAATRPFTLIWAPEPKRMPLGLRM